MRKLHVLWKDLNTTEKENYEAKASAARLAFSIDKKRFEETRPLADYLLDKERHRLQTLKGLKSRLSVGSHPDVPKPPGPVGVYFYRDLGNWSVEQRKQHNIPDHPTVIQVMKIFKTLPESLVSEYRALRDKHFLEYKAKKDKFDDREDVKAARAQILQARADAVYILKPAPKRKRKVIKRIVKRVIKKRALKKVVVKKRAPKAVKKVVKKAVKGVKKAVKKAVKKTVKAVKKTTKK